MNLGRKASLVFIVGGVLAVAASLYSAETLIPEQIKLFGGIALIVFGLGVLLLVQRNEESKQRNYLTILFVAVLLTGIVAYLYVRNSEGKKLSKSFGTFQVRPNQNTYQGDAILEGDKLTLQIKGITSSTRIDGFKLYIRNVEIEKRSIEWVCALMTDLSVIRCSTDLNLPKDNCQLFFDRGTYTISYWLTQALEDVKISDVSFIILTDTDQPVIKILERK